MHEYIIKIIKPEPLSAKYQGYAGIKIYKTDDGDFYCDFYNCSITRALVFTDDMLTEDEYMRKKLDEFLTDKEYEIIDNP